MKATCIIVVLYLICGLINLFSAGVQQLFMFVQIDKETYNKKKTSNKFTKERKTLKNIIDKMHKGNQKLRVYFV